MWTLDYRPDFTAAESGLDAFLRLDKPMDFIGKRAAAAAKARGPEKPLITLVVDANQVDAHRDEPIFREGRCVGYVTSGGYAHYVGKSVAMGYVRAKCQKSDAPFEIEFLGEMRTAIMQRTPLFDPNGERMKI